MYQVLIDFYEKKHKNTLYRTGDTYPKSGFKAGPERVAYLQSDKNPYKVAFLGPELETADETSKETSKPKGKPKNRSEE